MKLIVVNITRTQYPYYSVNNMPLPFSPAIILRGDHQSLPNLIAIGPE